MKLFTTRLNLKNKKEDCFFTLLNLRNTINNTLLL